MAKKDLSKFLGNNKKYNNSAMVATLTPALLKRLELSQETKLL